MKDSQMDLSKAELHETHKRCIANKEQLMAEQLSGVFTVDDDTLFRGVAMLADTEAIAVEPSACAGLPGWISILAWKTRRGVKTGKKWRPPFWPQTPKAMGIRYERQLLW